MPAHDLRRSGRFIRPSPWRAVFAWCLRAACVLGGFGGAPGAAALEGYQVIGIGPLQRGTSGAGAALGEDSTWMLLNPAAIADLPLQIDLYHEFVNTFRSVEVDGVRPIVNTLPGRQEHEDWVYFPAFSLTFPVDDLVLGWGLLGLGGTLVDFDRPRTTLGIPNNADRRGGYETAQMPFTVAKRFDNGWAAGAAAIFNIQRLRTDTLTLRLRPARANYEWDWSYGVGFGLGVQKQWDHWAFGLGYISRQHMTAFSKYSDIVRTPLDIPRRVQAGIAYQPTPKWTFLLDGKFIHYKSVRQLSQDATASAIGWSNVWAVKVGVRHHITDRLTLRLGYSHNDSPLDANDIFTNAQFPALAEDHFSAGFTWRVSDQLDIHAAYTRIDPESETDDGTGDLFSVIGEGTEIDLNVQTLSIGMTWRF